MYTNQQLNEKLKHFLKMEIDAVWFYIDHLPLCDYKKNKKSLDILLLDSIIHIKKITETILALQEESGFSLTKKVKERALKEEQGMADVYQYVLQRTDNKAVKKLLEELIPWEEKHEKIAQQLQCTHNTS